MAFSALHGIQPPTEIAPLNQTDEASEKDVLRCAARSRTVLTTR
ncbi:MAG: hypothetical protein QOF84_4607 [Streptomyces sp.]|jgi:hypothetical protein|nr:hypothetical protein [Streptomyces sp.]